MIAHDIATKVLDTELFPRHAIDDLNSGITFIVLFSQEKPLRRKKINTHTRNQYDTLAIKKIYRVLQVTNDPILRILFDLF